MQRPPPKYSIVIPAFNEAARLPRALEKIRTYLLGRNFDAEVVVVDDGSTDATAEIAREGELHWPAALRGVRLVSNGENRGKGYSVRHGMLEAQGEIALFTDADLSAPIEEIEKLLAALAAGNDVAIGSRALDRSLISIHQSRHRELA